MGGFGGDCFVEFCFLSWLFYLIFLFFLGMTASGFFWFFLGVFAFFINFSIVFYSRTKKLIAIPIIFSFEVLAWAGAAIASPAQPVSVGCTWLGMAVATLVFGLLASFSAD